MSADHDKMDIDSPPEEIQASPSPSSPTDTTFTTATPMSSTAPSPPNVSVGTDTNPTAGDADARAAPPAPGPANLTEPEPVSTPPPLFDKGKGKAAPEPEPVPKPQPQSQPPPKFQFQPQSTPTPQPEPEIEEPEDDEPKVDLSTLPTPDLQALLSKTREPGAHIEATSLSVPELRALLDRALALKADGNKNFTAKPPRLDAARDDYLCALDSLPSVPRHLPPPAPEDDRIREISDEEAELIEADWRAGPARIAVDNEIREAAKALWGNLGAVYAGKRDWKDVVATCTRALAFDPHYVKALHRRATANEHLGTWSALASAQRDLRQLMALLPADSPVLVGVTKSLDTLPARLAKAQRTETDEMHGKLGALAT